MSSTTDDQEASRQLSKSSTAVESYINGSASCSDPSAATPHREDSWTDKVIDLSRKQSRGLCESRPWTLKWMRFGPLSGVLGMILAATSLVASLGILAGSDGKPVDTWPAQPSTYLAIFTAIANLSMRYAAIQGVVITWWTMALKGSTLAKLHQSWRSGTSFKGAVAAGRTTGLLGLACIFSTLVVIDGPFLQRASRVHNIPNPGSVSIAINIAPELPHGWSGWWETNKQVGLPSYRSLNYLNSTVPTANGSVLNNIYANPRKELTTHVAQYWRNAPITGAVSGCSGLCSAKVRAPALFPTSCTTRSISADPWMAYDYDAVLETRIGAPLEVFGFVVGVILLLDSREAINLITGSSVYNDSCSGEFVYQACTLESGIGEYDITIKNDEILTDAMASPTFVAFANNTAINTTFDTIAGGYPSTLSVFIDATVANLDSYVTYAAPNAAAIATSGFKPCVYTASVADRFAYYGANSTCPPNHEDPYEFSLNALNKLMFYLGAAAVATQDEAYLAAHMDPGLSTKSTGKAHLQGTLNVYQTEYGWFVAAAVVEVVCILFVLPTYWGWWEIGRSVSFSPVELAKAFQSPLLPESNSNSTGNELAEKANNAVIKYGQVTSGVLGEKSKLAFGDVNSTTWPQNGARFDM